MLGILHPTLFCSKPENITDGGGKHYLTQETGEEIIGLTGKVCLIPKEKRDLRGFSETVGGKPPDLREVLGSPMKFL